MLRTREALLAYSFGLTGLISVKILAPAYYSRQDIRTPVKIALFTLALTQAMNFVFVFWLKHAGLALSTGLASCINAFVLYRGLRECQVFRPLPGWPAFLGKLGAALVVMATALWFGMGAEADWLQRSSAACLIHLALLVPGGALAYLGTLGLLGFHPRDFMRRTA